MNPFPNRTGVSLFLLATFALLAAAGTRLSSVQSASNVLVTNTTSQSVPVALQGTPNVRSLQGGTWNVYLLGSPTLRINNAPSAPIPVSDTADKQPFQQRVVSTVPDGVVAQQSYITNATSKRLEIDSIHVKTFPLTQNAYCTEANFYTSAYSAGPELNFSSTFPLTPATYFAGYASYGNFEVHIVLEPGQYLYFTGLRAGNSGDCSCTFTFVGHYVPLP